MRRVLLISFDFPPRGATGVLRITKFARYLPDFGWQPVVFTAAGDSVVRDEALLGELPSDLEVIRVADPLTRLRRGGGTQQPFSQVSAAARPRKPAAWRHGARRLLVPDPQITWLPRAVQAASARLRRGDVAAVLSTSPPHSMQLAGLWLKRRFPQVPWVMDMRDLWSDGGAITDPLVYKLNRACERACLQAADRVVVVTHVMRKHMQREFAVPDERIVTITNGFDRNDIVPAEPARNAALRIVYVGTITTTRTPSAHGLLAAMQRLAAGSVGAETVVLHAYGLFDPAVHAWAEPLAARGMVQLHPFVPHAEAIAATAAADALLVVVSDDLEGRIAMPNKLYEYVAVGKPLLALTPPGEVTRLIRELDAGIAVAPTDVDGIEAALCQLIAQHRAGTLPGFALNDARVQRFERRTLTQQLATLLDEVVA
jgi:glycosyltransferase involved in cell wall biosynthesis